MLGANQTVLGLIALLEILPMVLILLSVIGLLFPQVRANWVEKKYGLNVPQATTGAIAEIVSFIEEQDPNLTIKVNPLCPQYAFVYPLSFRQTGIGIGALLIKLWRSDQPKAEAILQHELAHYRHGDAFVVGAGSPLKMLVERWLFLYLCLFAVPYGIAVISLIGLLFKDLSTLGISLLFVLPQLIGHLIRNGLLLAFGAVVITLSLLLWMASLFVAPLLGLWCVEFNADQSAAQSSPSDISGSDILGAIALLPNESHWKRWLFSCLSHPPNVLRTWFLKQPNKQTGYILLLMSFPLGYLLRIVALSGRAMLAGNFELSMHWAAGLRGMAPAFLAIAVVLALWPICANRWAQLFTGYVASKPAISPTPYWVSAGVTIALAIIGYGQVF
ncbi:MAG: hypothetical protein AAFU53_07970 [Cyanobacteria bacterium J06632_3]